MQIIKHVLDAGMKTDLTAYLADDYTVIGEKERRPAVLICPGGAFLNLAEREGEPVALAFLNQGIQAFVLHYTLGDPERGVADILRLALNDYARAVRWIREQAEEWNIDVERLFIMGFSAGAYLTAMFGNRWQEKWLAEIAGVTGKASNGLIRAAILCYPMCDLGIMGEFLAREDCIPDVKALFEQANVALCGEAHPSREKMVRYSPISYVHGNTPATFIWHTEDDELVPVANSLAYAAELSRNGVPFELHVFDGGVHGLALATSQTAAKPEESNEHCAAWFEIMIKWLRERIF